MDKNYVEKIVILYVNHAVHKDEIYEKEMRHHPIPNKVYRAFFDAELGTYRLIFEDVDILNDAKQMKGIVIPALKVDDDKLTAEFTVVNAENCIDLDMSADEADKLASWLTGDSKDLAPFRIEELAKSVLGNLLPKSTDSLKIPTEKDPNKTADEVIKEQEDIYFDEEIFDESHLHHLYMIGQKDPLMLRILGKLITYLASTYSDKYAATSINTRDLYLSQSLGKGS